MKRDATTMFSDLAVTYSVWMVNTRRRLEHDLTSEWMEPFPGHGYYVETEMSREHS
jgi:hypothetical protein